MRRQVIFLTCFPVSLTALTVGKVCPLLGSMKKDSPSCLACGGYKLYGRKVCTNHFIDYGVLYRVVLESIQKRAAAFQEETEKLTDEIVKKVNDNTKYQMKEKNLSSFRRRLKELETIQDDLFEDKALCKISPGQYQRLWEKYQKEQVILLEKINRLQADLKQAEENGAWSLDEVQRAIKSAMNIQELTPKLLSFWIERIEIGQGTYEKTEISRRKLQEIHIFFRFAQEENTACFL